jgi:hypothetical protein
MEFRVSPNLQNRSRPASKPRGRVQTARNALLGDRACRHARPVI